MIFTIGMNPSWTKPDGNRGGFCPACLSAAFRFGAYPRKCEKDRGGSFRDSLFYVMFLCFLNENLRWQAFRRVFPASLVGDNQHALLLPFPRIGRLFAFNGILTYCFLLNLYLKPINYTCCPESLPFSNTFSCYPFFQQPFFLIPFFLLSWIFLFPFS